ncbi:unnamed protein product [Vitrella brassicaformis CCMP3155]|uniref:Uncharacterized protein n=1 Tax=Vitrella brassicaformis (strain CCMP3155) TaxID=1169540 RepID=A0A0G4EKN4_VITBC|nr:unnamed protein product [Vitrella brassicaformis CCMP3155]|eukprot:CEL97100.1 unnamed protein product [Vitrella brassicaformis CCMP3155]
MSRALSLLLLIALAGVANCQLRRLQAEGDGMNSDSLIQPEANCPEFFRNDTGFLEYAFLEDLGPFQIPADTTHSWHLKSPQAMGFDICEITSSLAKVMDHRMEQIVSTDLSALRATIVALHLTP